MVLLAESGAPLSVLIDKMLHYIMVSAQYFVIFSLLHLLVRKQVQNILL